LVVGSNGAIGHALTRALVQSSFVEGGRPPEVIIHAHDAYAQASLDLLQFRSDARPLRLLYCGGRGGFSLGATSAEQQHQVFAEFCRRLPRSFGLEKFVLISSLGAQCSGMETPYSQLVRSNEEAVLTNFGEHSLILRLPSIYGYHDRAQRYHGVIGVILRNLRFRRQTGIYARLETRRNYLSIHRLAPLLVRERMGGGLVEGQGCLNIQSSISLSIFDVCTAFFRAVRQRPVLKLMQHSLVDEEHHYPSRLHGARVIVNDPIGEWVSWQWNRSAHLFPS
jgi:nucleoside-diphosphate-sugar epimerase